MNSACENKEFDYVLCFQLLVVMERILSFPVTSPLMKILTGLEVLLRKAQVRSCTVLRHSQIVMKYKKTPYGLVREVNVECNCCLVSLAGGDSPIKMTGVLVGNFEKNP